MKKSIPLKWLVLIITFSLTIILIVGFSMLSSQYFRLGMDNVISGHLEQTIHKYHDSTDKEELHRSIRFDGYPISTTWQDQPENIRNVFKTAPEKSATLYKVENLRNKSHNEGVYFLIRWELDSQTYFISHHLTRKTLSKMVYNNIKRSRVTLKIIGVTCIILFGLVFWLIMHRIATPVAALNKWTRDLTPETLNQPIPDFSYSELNEQAELIRSSLSSVQKSLEREHKFLRHTSHELRTPISVIRSNVDLMHKLQQRDDSIKSPKQKEIFDRIDRASLTMKDLTETLLWLSRDEDENLPQKNIKIDELIQQIVDETKYLLNNKTVKLNVETKAATISTSEPALRIVLGNLIRNAFQHTYSGDIHITQTALTITIKNTYQDSLDEGQNNNDLGFGLGLQLTKQLTTKFKWGYINKQDANHNYVKLDFNSAAVINS